MTDTVRSQADLLTLFGDIPVIQGRITPQMMRDFIVSVGVTTGASINAKAAPYNAKGDGVTNDTAALQAAITAGIAAKQLVYLPAGDYLVSGSGTECLLANGIFPGIIGAGMNRSRIVVSATVGASTDVLRIVGSGATGLRMAMFSVVPVSGTPARYGINIDVSVLTLSYAVLDQIQVGTFGDYSIISTNPTPNIDGWFTTSLTDCVIVGGINFRKAGDSLRLIKSTITGVRGIVVDLVATASGGAHLLLIQDCNITCDAGTRVIGGSVCRIIHNNMEQPNVNTGPNQALIDLDGTVGKPIINAVIAWNFLGATTGNCLSTVRVNYATGACLFQNDTIAPGILPTYAAYRITANAIATMIFGEVLEPFGTVIDGLTEDLGTGTQIDWISPVGTNARYIGHKASKSVGILTQAGASQSAGAVLWGVIAAATTFANTTIQGFLRVFGNGNVRVGDGADNGFPLQTKGNASLDGDIFLEATRVVKGRDTAGTAIQWGAFSNIDNFLRIGANSAPATAGGTILQHQGVEVARVGPLGFGLNRTANSATWQTGSASELLVLSTSTTFTDTAAQLLPANSIIEAVVARVQTTIVTATDWKLGDPTTVGRFTAANSNLTAGTLESGPGLHVDQTGAPGPRQVAAAKVRVTTTGTPSAGAVRITVFYRTFVAPAS
jgi:hypothetical protein